MLKGRPTRVGFIAIAGVVLAATMGAGAVVVSNAAPSTPPAATGEPTPTAAELHAGYPVASPATVAAAVPVVGGELIWSLDNELPSVAQYLGISTTTLQSELQNGHTLAEIARANGKSTTGLENYLVQLATVQIQQRVTSGSLTQTTADDMIARLRTRLGAGIEGAPPAP